MQKHRPVDNLRRLTGCPVLLIHGTVDPVIPFSEFERLREAAPTGTRFWIVEGAGHIGSLGHRDYPAHLEAFLGNSGAPAPSRGEKESADEPTSAPNPAAAAH